MMDTENSCKMLGHSGNLNLNLNILLFTLHLYFFKCVQENVCQEFSHTHTYTDNN